MILATDLQSHECSLPRWKVRGARDLFRLTPLSLNFKWSGSHFNFTRACVPFPGIYIAVISALGGVRGDISTCLSLVKRFPL